MKAIFAVLIAAAIGLASNVYAQQSPCQGLDKTACTAKQIAGVSICTYVGPYYTTNGAVEYCRISGRKITREQYEAIQAAINGGNTPTADTANNSSQ